MMGPHLALLYGKVKGATMDSLDSLERLLETEKKASRIIEEAEAAAAQIRLDAQKNAAALEQEKLLEARRFFEAETARIKKDIENEVQTELDTFKLQLQTLSNDKDELAKLVRDAVRQDK